MNLDFLSADAALATERFTPLARSPMEHDALAAGARFEVRNGWNLAASYSSAAQESAACRRAAGWADVSHLGKLELQGSPEGLQALAGQCAGAVRLELGHATRAAEAWWCPVTQTRALVICAPAVLPGLRLRLVEAARDASPSVGILDVSTVFAALTLVGPLARELFARFTAIDLRPQVTPVGSLRPGSIGRQPGLIVHEADNRYLFMFGWAVAHYMWTVVEDAGRHLGASPVGLDVLAPLPAARAEVPWSA